MHMEIEEQKPKDLLLDREIKQETEDSLENVKEECEKECFQKIVLKLEEVVAPLTSKEAYQLGHLNVFEQEEHKPKEHFEKEIKGELVDEERYEQTVPKLEEVIDPCSTEFHYHDSSFFPTVNDNFSSDPRPFQPRIRNNLLVGEHNPVVFLTESIASFSNQKSFQSAIIRDDVKLEAINDDCEDSGKRKMLDNDISRNRKIAGQFRLSSRHRCMLCLEMKIRQNVKNVTLKNERLVLMVGFVLSNRHTYEEAQSFMSRKKSIVCHAHFSEALEAIYKSLQIESSGEIATCSNTLMENLMITVKTFSPKIEIWEFQKFLRDFAWRNLKELPIPTASITFSTGRIRCSVCSQVRTREGLNIVDRHMDKVIIMVGCLLRGDYSLEQALSFLSRQASVFICHGHFSDGIEEIYKVLQIKTPMEIFSCPHYRMKCVTNIVTALQSSISGFSNFLYYFVTKYWRVSQIKLGQSSSATIRC